MTKTERLYLVLACIGFGLYWFNGYITVPDWDLPLLGSALWARLARVIITFAFALLFFGRRRIPRGAFVAALAVQGATLALSLLRALTAFSVGPVITAAMTVIQGYAVAVFILLYAQVLASYPPETSRLAIPVAFILAHVVLSLQQSLAPEVELPVLSGCLAVSLVLLVLCARRRGLLGAAKGAEGEAVFADAAGVRHGILILFDKRNVLKTLETILIYGLGLFVFPILNGLVAQISFAASVNSGLRDLVSQLFCICAILVLLVVCISAKRAPNCKRFTIILVPVVVTALALSPQMWNSEHFSSSILVKCAYVILTVIVWVELAALAHRHPQHQVALFGVLGFPALGLVVGRVLGGRISAHAPIDFSAIAGVSIGAIWIILMVVVVWSLLKERENAKGRVGGDGAGAFFEESGEGAGARGGAGAAGATAAGVTAGEGAREGAGAAASAVAGAAAEHRPNIDEQCARLALATGLSKRESEIMTEYAKGRSAVYISNELTISEYTVKSHLRRIYQKANVHDRQELLDLLEQY